MHRYTAIIKFGGQEYELYAPDSDSQIYGDSRTEELGVTQSFSFTVPPDHPCFEKIEPLATRVFLYDRGELVYDYRVINDKQDILQTGMVQTAGRESYLADSQCAPFKYTGSVSGFIKMLLDQHNLQSEMKFSLGQVTVTDPNDTIVRELNTYTDTLAVLRQKTEQMLGGWLRFRYVNDHQYMVDYLYNFGMNEQFARLGENILNLNAAREPAEFFTRLLPLGADLMANDTTSLPQYVTIAPVNNNVTYLENPEMKQKYGTIVKTVQWKDITLPSNLLKKARAYMAEMTGLPRSIEVPVADLSYIEEVDGFHVGCITTVISERHGIHTQYLLAKKTSHITAPQNDSIVLGETAATLTRENIKEESSTIQAIADSQANTNHFIVETGMTISGAKGGYVILDSYDSDGNPVQPWQILIMDQPSKATARNVIRLNQNGIGFSTTGYNGEYRNAWTIDGVLDADFIKTGNLTVGGSLFNTDGAIIVKNSQNKEIGRWDKNGFLISQGIISGTTISGSTIIVQDASGKEIGRWDKNGFSISRGSISGTTISGSTIIVQDTSGKEIGRWDKNGFSVSRGDISGSRISGGSIDVGCFFADDDKVEFGDFYVSNDGTNTIQSNDGAIVITMEDQVVNNLPAIRLTSGSDHTRISSRTIQVPNVVLAGLRIETPDIYLGNLEEEYGFLWRSLSKNIIEIWDDISGIKDRLDNLEG